MSTGARRTICWVPTWNAKRPEEGLEHLLIADLVADSVVLAFDEYGRSFRLSYHLGWDDAWCLRSADFAVVTGAGARSLCLRADGRGNWWDDAGLPLPTLTGCLDIDIWPSPFTNTFPIRRERMTVGERREIHAVWVHAPTLDVKVQAQAYTRLDARRYRFETRDGAGFAARLEVDDEGVVLDYEGLFRRVLAPGSGVL